MTPVQVVRDDAAYFTRRIVQRVGDADQVLAAHVTVPLRRLDVFVPKSCWMYRKSPAHG